MNKPTENTEQSTSRVEAERHGTPKWAIVLGFFVLVLIVVVIVGPSHTGDLAHDIGYNIGYAVGLFVRLVHFIADLT